jgi:hypothetical protein
MRNNEKLTIYRTLIFYCFSISISIFVIISCDNNPHSYAPIKLVKGKKTNPIEDFDNLNRLFFKSNGNLTSSNDEIVRWKDTKMFRLFELDHHTVVIFPYNWDRDGFDLIFFAGHVINYDNLFNSIRFRYRPNSEEGTDYINNTMIFNLSDPSIKSIRFEGFNFGDSLDTVKKKQIPIIEKRWKNNKEQKDLRVSFLTAAKDHVWGKAVRSKFRLYFHNNQVVYMHFWKEGFPQLGGYSIDKPVLPVIEQGEFDIQQIASNISETETEQDLRGH